VPRADRPPVHVVHVAFQVMVGCGTALAAVSVLAALLAWRRRGLPDQRWFLRLVTLCGPLGFIALEAGWTVTEVGRQPWVVRDVVRTADAVTPMPGLVVPLVTFTAVYVFLSVILVYVLRRQFLETDPTAPGRSGASRGG